MPGIANEFNTTLEMLECAGLGAKVFFDQSCDLPDQVAIAACHQHFSVLQQRRHVFFATDMKRAGRGPPVPPRIVDFDARHTFQAIITAGEQHAPIEEQGGSVAKTGIFQTARR